MKIFLSFVGRNDRDIENQDGPIKGLLKERQFDRIFLFYNNVEEFLPIASGILKYCEKKYPDTIVQYKEAKSIDPTDYNIVYPVMVAGVQEIKREFPEAEYTISVSSGTPTMHACWLMIAQGGIIGAELVQVSKEKGIQPVNFELDDFPRIKAPSSEKAKMTKLSRENEQLKDNLLEGLDNIIGKSEAMLTLKSQVKQFARTPLPIYINGETGTGKELVANAVHLHSKCGEGPFIKVNCGAIKDSLIESELFGHKKGAFTGAVNDRKGYFREAHKGTLFLDEIGDLPPDAQVKLLRAIQEKKVMPVGSDKEEDADVRMVCASHKDLNKLVEEGTFRQDLYFRIVGKIIVIPPLRSRREDIAILANVFLRRLNLRDRGDKKFDKSAIKKLNAHHWPGNVRELETIVEVAYEMADDIIQGSHIEFLELAAQAGNGTALAFKLPPEGIDLNNELLPEVYDQALQMANGNAAEAARLLRLQPHAFRARLNKLEK
jgi:transcriptional regulator with GAF, ATPase, and Fis domain